MLRKILMACVAATAITVLAVPRTPRREDVEAVAADSTVAASMAVVASAAAVSTVAAIAVTATGAMATAADIIRSTVPLSAWAFTGPITTAAIVRSVCSRRTGRFGAASGSAVTEC